MKDAVDTVLSDRARSADGMGPMLSLSVLLHGALIVLIALAPRLWPRPARTDLGTVMTISLAGAPGPRAGGMTPMGGRPIQKATEPASKRPEPVRPPAARTPEMTLPATKSAPRQAVRNAPEEARGRTPTRGTEERPGSAIAETGGRGLGFGLTTGGGGGTGSYLDVGNFCCPEYLQTMIQLIQRNWNSKQSVAGDVLVKFTIQRDGRLTDIELERSSGFIALDLSAQRAVALTQRLPPLPGQFPDNTLTVHLSFQYQR